MDDDDDDSLVAWHMANQNNDDAIGATAHNNSGNNNNTANGEPPHLVRTIDLPELINRPSGSMVKIKCPAAGKLIEREGDKFHFIRNK